jgi:hypothetical protein
VALTGTSSLISGLILIFEWWYFKKYGTSFIEQVSLNYIANPIENDPNNPANTNINPNNNSNNSINNNNSSNSGTFMPASSTTQPQSSSVVQNDTSSLSKFDSDTASTQLLIPSLGSSHTCSNLNCTNSGSCSNLNSAALNATVPECKVWKNPMSLMRGAEYSKLTQTNSKEPLTFYDMNLSAQDHQTFFTCDYDEGNADYEIMQRAWRERNQTVRLSLAHEALSKNQE